MSNPFEEVVEQLAKATESVSVTAAAGCGKTEAIVRAVALSEGKQLILTHTNAGVAALRSRLRRYSVPVSKYRVETIASWLLKYAIAYPSMSRLTNPRPQGEAWKEVYPAVRELFNYPFIRDVLKASYAGVFVDEYQDCTQQQHEIALMISEFLPVRVLGDPLQGIFGFQDDPLVKWEDMQGRFKPLPDLIIPYRWKKSTKNPNANTLLGEQLAEIRIKLLAGEPINLGDYSAIEWLEWSEEQESAVCKAVEKRVGTIAGIHKWPEDAHKTARRMGGTYQSIEEMDCRDLMKVSRQIDEDRDKGDYQALANRIKNFVLNSCANRNPFGNRAFQKEFAELEQGDLSVISRIIKAVMDDRDMQVYRRELLTEMARSAQEFASGNYDSFEEAAYAARYRTRVNGRRPENRIISRTLLIKGLEFDHAVVLNADELENRENFYVAITRGLQSLTILSTSKEIDRYARLSWLSHPSG